MREPQHILSEAIELYKPVQVVCLYSGGYDSLCATHLAHRLDTHGVPMAVWSIYTNLAADGWREYVSQVATELDFAKFSIYDNVKGFEQFTEFVRLCGAPYSRAGHKHAYRRLKDRAISAIHMLYKVNRHDKTLFLSGMRRAESRDRKDADEYHQEKKSSKCFVSPLVHWSDEDIASYRIDHDLPDNPFYSTVKGSGDCQCNWGNFIKRHQLRRYSPKLEAGNVAMLDKLSKENHGYGWDEVPPNPHQPSLFDEDDSTFLCSNCSRVDKQAATEWAIMQRG